MPQPKKHASTRRRANKASTAATLNPEGPANPKIPELPERELGWHSLTTRWWTDVWSSPMSEEWHLETDLHNVYAAAMHYDDMWRAESPADRQKADAAFQKREAALGLTPYDRRRLEWTIATASEATARTARRTSAPAPKASPKPDPRGGLHAVS